MTDHLSERIAHLARLKMLVRLGAVAEWEGNLFETSAGAVAKYETTEPDDRDLRVSSLRVTASDEMASAVDALMQRAATIADQFERLGDRGEADEWRDQRQLADIAEGFRWIRDEDGGSEIITWEDQQCESCGAFPDAYACPSCTPNNDDFDDDFE